MKPTALAQLQEWLVTPRENENLEFKEAKEQFAIKKLLLHGAAIGNQSSG